ncbi:MAG: hypothetical protein ACI8ZN_002286 [Bacteroidia bacterium]|jgi:uncharacterized protein YbjT (DUF2867 family)
MNVIITGATGMVGKGVLFECCDHPKVDRVLSISRRPCGETHPKLEEVLHTDFSEFESISDKLVGFDTCFSSMGVSAAGMDEAKYTRLTHGTTLALAREVIKHNPKATFIYVSGQGTDSTEKGRQMWARVKGKTENDLLKLGFEKCFVFRPGAIIPLRGIQPSSKLYRVLINNLGWLIKLIKFVSPNSVVDTSQIGKAMINAHLKGYSKEVITPKDMLLLSSN